MKRKIFILLMFFIFMCQNCYVQGADTLFDIRNKIFEESKQLRPLLKKSKNAILLTNMWDTCIIVTTQLDAYFSMLGILNTVKDQNLTEVSVDYLIDWLNDVKTKNAISIKILEDTSVAREKIAKKHMKRLVVYFKELDQLLEDELEKIDIVIKALKIRK